MEARVSTIRGREYFTESKIRSKSGINKAQYTPKQFWDKQFGILLNTVHTRNLFYSWDKQFGILSNIVHTWSLFLASSVNMESTILKQFWDENVDLYIIGIYFAELCEYGKHNFEIILKQFWDDFVHLEFLTIRPRAISGENLVSIDSVDRI